MSAQGCLDVALGTLFKISEKIPTKTLQRAHSTNDVLDSPETADRNSDNGSVVSDMFADGVRIMTLRANDAEVRCSIAIYYLHSLLYFSYYHLTCLFSHA